jgi:hypothetical protein
MNIFCIHVVACADTAMTDEFRAVRFVYGPVDIIIRILTVFLFDNRLMAFRTEAHI